MDYIIADKNEQYIFKTSLSDSIVEYTREESIVVAIGILFFLESEKRTSLPDDNYYQLPFKQLSFYKNKNIVQINGYDKVISYDYYWLKNNRKLYYNHLSNECKIDVAILESFDIEMLYQLIISGFIYHIKNIIDDKIEVGNTTTYVRGKIFDRVTNISHHKLYKSYKKNKLDAYNNSSEVNLFNISSKERAFFIKDIFKDVNITTPILLLNNTTYILDGLHRCVLLRINYGKHYVINIKRLFIDNFELPKNQLKIKKHFVHICLGIRRRLWEKW